MRKLYQLPVLLLAFILPDTALAQDDQLANPTYLAGALDMFASLNPDRAQCAQDWFYNHGGEGAAISFHEEHPEYTGAALLHVLINRHCLTRETVQADIDRAKQAIDSARAAILRDREELLNNACRLPDGTPIFVSDDGRDWFFENGEPVPPELAKTCR